MLKSLTSRNYRSLEELSFPFAALTAIVGPNGSGKTSILRAIDTLLGTNWPSIRSIRLPNDFTRFDASRDLSIEVEFDPPLRTPNPDALGKQYPVPTLRATCAPYKRAGKKGDVGDLHFDFQPLDAKGKAITTASKLITGKGPEWSPMLQVSTGLRDQARILMIDHRRSIAQHLPSMRGSVLGKLFEPARKEFEKLDDAGEGPKKAFRDRYAAAMDVLRLPMIQEIEQTIGNTAKSMIGFLGSSAVGEIDISFGFADPANPFNSLRLVYREGDFEIPGEELGLGIQSAVVVGIFEALRQLGGAVGTVLVEEPEMYLHPQAQRYFYKLLSQLADRGDCQVIYSTHSPIFADATRFESIRLVRKDSGKMTRVTYVQRQEDISYLETQRKAQKLGGGFDPSRSEVLFARKALLVEGLSDKIAVQLAASKIGEDIDAEDLAVVPCGSKSAIPFFARTCRSLGIPVVVLHDEDIYVETGDAEKDKKIKMENAEAQTINARIKEAVGDASRIFVVAPSLESQLGISRDANEKPRRVLEALESLELTDMPLSLRDAVQELFRRPEEKVLSADDGE